MSWMLKKKGAIVEEKPKEIKLKHKVIKKSVKVNGKEVIFKVKVYESLKASIGANPVYCRGLNPWSDNYSSVGRHKA